MTTHALMEQVGNTVTDMLKRQMLLTVYLLMRYYVWELCTSSVLQANLL